MKSKFKFKKNSPGWHYDKFNAPDGELTFEGKIKIDKNSLRITEDIIDQPFKNNGIKRIHVGDPAEKVENQTISERVHRMKEVGYNKDNYFIEFIDEKFTAIEKKLCQKFNINYYHYCAVIITPGQCMPVHDDTYSYLIKYLSTEFPEIKYNVLDIKRYCVFLTDWNWGQSFGAGNTIASQWKIGDVYTWKHKMLHWCSNSSLDPIVFFEITGIK